MCKRIAILLAAVVGTVSAGDGQSPLTGAEIDACVTAGVLTNEQADQLSGARTPHAEYRTELPRVANACERYLEQPEAERVIATGPRSEREERMLQGAATPYAEYRTSYTRLSAEEARKSGASEAEEERK
ncbi:MAG TPA: hypothetical protein VND91_03925 [Candidatus Saccharimonadia bacterium]|nr:hypothetical protein [Candidatus Saccharimonadia bacterium]